MRVRERERERERERDRETERETDRETEREGAISNCKKKLLTSSNGNIGVDDDPAVKKH